MSLLDSSLMKKSNLLFVGGGLATGIIMNQILNRLKTNSSEGNVQLERWVRVGTISDLIIYPVKSLPGIKVDRAITTEIGLQDASNPNLADRTFVITNGKGDFQTQRTIPSLALIHPNVEGEVLLLKYLGEDDNAHDSISVPFPKNDGKNRQLVRIWSDKVYALDCGDEIAEWLNKVTGSKDLRLFHHDGNTSQRKHASSTKGFPMFSTKDLGTFQDETAFMLMTETSMDELNSKMERKMTQRSFRPCFMLKDVVEPWAEDYWTFIRIGGDEETSPILKTSMPCQRCKLTTIDPDTGKFIDDGEPLKSLTSLKRPARDATVTKIVKNSAIMGAHFGLFRNANAIISLGDPVYAALL